MNSNVELATGSIIIGGRRHTYNLATGTLTQKGGGRPSAALKSARAMILSFKDFGLSIESFKKYLHEKCEDSPAIERVAVAASVPALGLSESQQKRIDHLLTYVQGARQNGLSSLYARVNQAKRASNEDVFREFCITVLSSLALIEKDE